MKTPIVRLPGDVFQRETVESLKQLNSSLILQGVLVENVDLTTTTTRVPHGLGRPYVGYIVVKQNAGATIWVDDTATKANPDVYLPLDASATVTVSLWIF